MRMYTCDYIYIGIQIYVDSSCFMNMYTYEHAFHFACCIFAKGLSLDMSRSNCQIQLLINIGNIHCFPTSNSPHKPPLAAHDGCADDIMMCCVLHDQVIHRELIGDYDR